MSALVLQLILQAKTDQSVTLQVKMNRNITFSYLRISSEVLFFNAVARASTPLSPKGLPVRLRAEDENVRYRRN